MHNLKISRALAVLAVTAFVSACGGGGGGAEAPIPNPKGKPHKPADPLPMGLFEKITAQGVPEDTAAIAIQNYDIHRADIANERYFSIIDFRIHSKNPRLFVVNIASGDVDAIHVAHGSGSDPDNNGLPQYFSNVPNSKRSSLGAYLISEKYYGKYGAAMRTDGLEKQNSMVRSRNIVMHGSKYVKDGKAKQGMSWGCPAVPFSWISKLIDRLRDGSFLYAYGSNKVSAAIDAIEVEQILIDPYFQWLDESEDAPLDGE